jgi:hypothetical protein
MRIRPSLLLALPVIGLATPAEVTATPRARHEPPPRSFTLDVRFGVDPFIDVGAAGPSVGDIRVLDDRLLRSGRHVGRDGGSCVVTNASRPEAACTVTFKLPRGTIAGQWLNRPPARKAIAVIGGTGIYRRARGQMIVFERSSARGTVTFRLLDAPNRL